MAHTLDTLSDGFGGELITHDHADYEEARQVFYGGVDGHPALIAQVASSIDAAAVVSYARENDLELAIRGGGHSPAGHSTTDGGVVLDLSRMKGLDIDVEGETAWAETGLTAIEYLEKVTEHGLITGFGDAGSVGIGGITLGGGVGYLVRKHGLTIDSLLGAEIVTADGEILMVDDEQDPDLFWAIRGGGGNFGVATRLHLRLHPLEGFVGGILILPATPETVLGFVAESEAAPEGLSTIVNVMNAPPMPFIPEALHGSLIVLGLLAWVGDEDEGQEVMGRFRALAEPLADMTGPGPFTNLYPPEDPEYKPLAVARTMFADSLDETQVRDIIDRLNESDAPLRAVQLRVLGGAMARVPSDATAFAHRNRRLMINVASFYETEDDRQRREDWVAALAAELDGGDPSGYVGFLALEGPDRVRAAYPGPTWDRLRQVKAKYDPENLFRLNQNIPPAS